MKLIKKYDAQGVNTETIKYNMKTIKNVNI